MTIEESIEIQRLVADPKVSFEEAVKILMSRCKLSEPRARERARLTRGSQMTTQPPAAGEKYREICSQSNPTHYKGERPDCEACRDWCPKCQRAYTACYCHDQGEQVVLQSPATEKASETPRTDSIDNSWDGNRHLRSRLSDLLFGHARTLERELTAAQRQVEELREQLVNEGLEADNYAVKFREQAAEVERLRQVLGDIQVWSTQALTCTAVTLDIAPGFEQIADAAQDALSAAHAGERVISRSEGDFTFRIPATDGGLPFDFIDRKGDDYDCACVYRGDNDLGTGSKLPGAWDDYLHRIYPASVPVADGDLEKMWAAYDEWSAAPRSGADGGNA